MVLMGHTSPITNKGPVVAQGTVITFHNDPPRLEMAMDTRNQNTRRVLPDIKVGTGWFLYLRVC
jgi:hypothetical protein